MFARALGSAIGGLLLACGGRLDVSFYRLLFMGVILFLFGWRPVESVIVLPGGTFLGEELPVVCATSASVSLVSSLKQVFIFYSWPVACGAIATYKPRTAEWSGWIWAC